MTNKITVPSELIHRAIDAVEQVGYQDKFIDYTFVGAVKNELRAALAEPVPPAESWEPIHDDDLTKAETFLSTRLKDAMFFPAHAHELANISMHCIREVRATRAELTKARELQRASDDIVAIAKKIDKEAFAKGTQNVDVSTFKSLGYALERLSNQSAPAEESYPPCDYCGTVPDYHPWHGSGLINGEESPHIHACNECRAKLPAPADKGQGEPLIHITPEVLAMLRGVRKMMAGGLTYSQSKPVGNWTVPLYTEQPAPVAVVMPDRDNLRDIIAQAIGGDTYDCTRVWSAWGVGTMSEDDFVQLVDQEARLYEIADACLDELARLNGVKP